jgi:hypothetical protein
LSLTAYLAMYMYVHEVSHTVVGRSPSRTHGVPESNMHQSPVPVVPIPRHRCTTSHRTTARLFFFLLLDNVKNGCHGDEVLLRVQLTVLPLMSPRLLQAIVSTCNTIVTIQRSVRPWNVMINCIWRPWQLITQSDVYGFFFHLFSIITMVPDISFLQFTPHS